MLRRFGGLWRTRAAVAEVSTAAGVSYNSRRPSRPLHTSSERENEPFEIELVYWRAIFVVQSAGSTCHGKPGV